MKGITSSVTVVATYAPTFNAGGRLVQDDPRDATDSAPSGDRLLFAGGWNSKPGPVDTATQHNLGKFALGPSNDF